jgi:hypothetical protein
MKKLLKLKFVLASLFFVFISCENEDFSDADYSILPPDNVSAHFVITQDNTGTVTITPQGDGALKFDVNPGNGDDVVTGLNPGSSSQHVYDEGSYNVGVKAYGYNNLVNETNVPLEVTFRAPENLQVNLVKDALKLTVSATADYATYFTVDFGNGQDPVDLQKDQEVSFTYDNSGDYDIKVTALSGGNATTVYEETVSMSAPTFLPVAFESFDKSTLISFGGASHEIIDNPDATGLNTSAKVVKVVKNAGETWAGSVLQLTEPIDIDILDQVTMKVWSPKAGTKITFKLENVDDGSINSGELTVETKTAQAWEEVSWDFSGIDKTKEYRKLVFFFELGTMGAGGEDWTFYIDDVNQKANITEPQVKSPKPNVHPDNAISLFSDHFTNITLTDVNPDWGQSTKIETVKLDGDSMWKLTDLNYQGLVTNYDPGTNVSGMEYVHFDYWTIDASKLGLKLVNTTGPTGAEKESLVFTDGITKGQWVSVDIPLSQYTTVMSAITQLVWDGTAGTIWIDNLYFYKSPGSEPTNAAPTPTTAVENVVASIYSDSYADKAVGLSDVGPDWGQKTVFEEVTIDGNKAWKYTDLDYFGIVTNYDPGTDLSAATTVHFDYWTPDASKLGLKLVNTTGPEGEEKESIVFTENLVKGGWVSVDIPLTDYTTVMSAITQILWDTAGGSDTVYIDNLYFYEDIPDTGAPAPTTAVENVVASIYSDSYADKAVGLASVGEDWGQKTVFEEVTIDGNKAWKFAGLDYIGIVTNYDPGTDVSTATTVHFDYWTPDATKLGLKLVNTTGPVDGEKESIVFKENLTKGGWVSVDIPLSDYTTVMTAITQLLFDTAGNRANVYIDNLYFYKN